LLYRKAQIEILGYRELMKNIAKIFLIRIKDLVLISTCNICGGQLTGSLYIMQAVGSAFINSHISFFLNQKDCRQEKLLL
jgi:hypothetical protein